ncbi:hypothetical protein [Rhodovulum sp. FJ3]|uniref:hypothetical protein n=1 Tax=Rhodovulum sp. FJ3 TaxID=3079053 RepID=UPI00293DC2B4|nr:hypothetical protein [Rhodovulum sp. FJ3]MDV4167938.1 hypothetical protein [Rhodovulum sp. FJ3]
MSECIMKTFEDVAVAFEGIADRVEKIWYPHISKTTTFKEQSWNAPGLAPEDACLLARDIADRIRNFGADEEGSESTEELKFWSALASQAEKVDFTNFTSDKISVARSTFEFLLFCNAYLPTRPADVDWDKVKAKGYIPKDLSRKIGSIEKRIKDLSPRTESLQEKIVAIETAHDAAEQLPTDMEELRRNNSELRKLLKEAQKNAALIQNNLDETETVRSKVQSLHDDTTLLADQSQQLVDRCNENYRITTSAGLAGAFEARSKSLTMTGWFWVFLLAVALGCAVGIGYFRLEAYESLLSNSAETSVILLNLLVTFLGVGGPIWLAWLSTKNIGQSFKLAEDYAFKASISKAYEGYRKEAVNLDQEFAKQLFGSALTRLDELPSRFVSQVDHSSPLQEALDNPTIKAFFAEVPDVKNKLIDFVSERKNAFSVLAGTAVASKTTKNRPNGSPESATEEGGEK